MSWAAIKQQARDAIHQTMGVQAFYTPVATGVESATPITARLHQKSAYIGDDYDGDFNPGVFAQIDRVILDTTEIPDPKRLDQIRFPDYDNVIVYVENRVFQGQNRVMCEVVVEP